MAAKSETSTANPSEARPNSPATAGAPSLTLADWSHKATEHPSREKPRAHAHPMPLAPPVTIATLPPNSKSTLDSFHRRTRHRTIQVHNVRIGQPARALLCQIVRLFSPHWRLFRI